MIRVPVAEALERLGHGGKWVQGATRTRRGAAACLHAAIRDTEYVRGDAALIEQVAIQQGWGQAFNDDQSTVFDDVRRVLNEHQVIGAGELAETFGPNWELVTTIVRQAASLDSSAVAVLQADVVDSSELGAAARGGQVVAGLSSRGVVSARASAAALAAVSAVRPDVAAVAARAAAAVTLVDLVGWFEFSAGHYAALTVGWRAVFPGFDRCFWAVGEVVGGGVVDLEQDRKRCYVVAA